MNPDLTELNAAFFKLCASIGIANHKHPENLTAGNFDMIDSDIRDMLTIAEALFKQAMDTDK